MNFYTARVYFNYTAVAFFVIFAEDESQALDLLRKDIDEQGDKHFEDSFYAPDSDGVDPQDIKLVGPKAGVSQSSVTYVGWAGD